MRSDRTRELAISRSNTMGALRTAITIAVVFLLVVILAVLPSSVTAVAVASNDDAMENPSSERVSPASRFVNAPNESAVNQSGLLAKPATLTENAIISKGSSNSNLSDSARPSRNRTTEEFTLAALQTGSDVPPFSRRNLLVKHQQQQRKLQQHGKQDRFSTQAAAAGLVHGYRVTSAIQFITSGQSTLNSYRYYMAENLISLQCTGCSSVSIYAGWTMFYDQAVAWGDACTSASFVMEADCDSDSCTDYPAGLKLTSCPSTQTNANLFWTSAISGSYDVTFKKAGCNSDASFSTVHASTVATRYSIVGGTAMAASSSLAQYGAYQLSVAATSIGSPRSGTETSFILEVSIRNIIERTLAFVKAGYEAADTNPYYYRNVYSDSIVDFEIDITSSVGALVTSLTYIAVNHSYLPFASQFLTESNEAAIQSIFLLEKRSNT